MGASISAENWCKRCNSIDHVTETCPLNYKTPFISRNRESGFVHGGTPPKKRPAPRSIMETHAGYTIRRMGSAGLGRRACISTGVRPVGIILTPAPSALKRSLGGSTLVVRRVTQHRVTQHCLHVTSAFS